MKPLPGAVDIAIVGAGAAGLAAARTAIGAGLSVLVLEAKDRAGGRAWTRALRGVPVDLGAHWLHSADINPLAEFGRRHGFTLDHPILDREIFFPDLGRWADSAELEERRVFFDACEAAIAAAAGRDVPIIEVLPDHPRWRPMFEHWVTVYTAADPTHTSTADYAYYRDTHENWPVREGYGALVARYGEGLPVARAAPVAAIEWGGRRARLETPAGTVEARAVIVTVSTAVLASGAIRYDPPLPGWKRDAVEAVPLGSANWVILAFDDNVFGIEASRRASVWAPDGRAIGFQLRPYGADIALAYLGGSLSAELEAAGPDGMTAFAMDGLTAAFGSSIRRRLAGSLTSAWGRDPHVRGAYSTALPGEFHRRADLAAPVEDRLFFAGEATDPEFFTTVHGAFRSGVRAAEAAAAVLRRR